MSESGGPVMARSKSGKHPGATKQQRTDPWEEAVLAKLPRMSRAESREMQEQMRPWATREALADVRAKDPADITEWDARLVGSALLNALDAVDA